MCNLYPMSYYEFFISFNEGDFYTCHDLLEEIWLTDRQNLFIKGLLHLSVALYHYSYGNVKGTHALLLSSHTYLSNYDGVYWGIAVPEVVDFIDDCLTIISQLSIEDDCKGWDELPEFPQLYLNIGEDGEIF
ncbi:DUF309 domain-containing protein [Thalassobacillus sp. B23F22_16]|uniref:DUF309 domain-containing protein n=1 Tax=Thalassobacillus sp. B23F22_16 TaxID=3459513 RepID=UPI00373DFBC2